MIETGRIYPEVVEDDDGKKKKSKHWIRVRVFKKEGSNGSSA
jgi:hypothetical protein